MDSEPAMIGHSTIRIAVLVPCFNEEAAVATVVADFRKALPSAQIFVYDNNSSDRTVAVAREAGRRGAQRTPPGQGPRGAADVRRRRCRHLRAGRRRRDLRRRQRAAHDRDAAVDHLDMVVGLRVDQAVAAYRPGHRTGNWMLTSFLSTVFGQAFRTSFRLPRVLAALREILPRARRRFRDRDRAQRACARAGAAGRRDRDARLRPAGGSLSKLNTWRDGFESSAPS